MKNLKTDFRAAGDGVTDDSPALDRALNGAGGDVIYVPPGTYRLGRPVATPGPVNLLGAGHGCGPGPAAVTSDRCSQFMIAFPNGGAAITVTNLPPPADPPRTGPSTFRGLQFNVSPAAIPGQGAATYRDRRTTGIVLTAAGSLTHANSVVEACGFSNVWLPVRMTKPTYNRVRDCYFDNWKAAGIWAETAPGVEGAPGWVENNYFFGETFRRVGVVGVHTDQGPAVYSECGYITVARNVIIGATAGVRVNVKNYPAGGVKVYQNWIEMQRQYGVFVSTNGANLRGGAEAATLVEVSQNEFSNVPGGGDAGNDTNRDFVAHIYVADSPTLPDWVSAVAVRDNVMRSLFRGDRQTKFIWVDSGQNTVVSGNVIQSIGLNPSPAAPSGPFGIQVTGAHLRRPLAVVGNAFSGPLVNAVRATPGPPAGWYIGPTYV